MKHSELPEVGIPAIIPLSMLTDCLFFRPEYYGYNSPGESAYTVFGVPILIFNFWAWVYPEVIEFYFFGKDGKVSET